MTSQPTITFNDGHAIPQIGFGVWKIGDKEAVDTVATALKAGYRSIDTAKAYGNEAGVGRAVRECGIARGEIFVTTKLANDDQGYDETLRAFDGSMERLGLDVLDLYLIHWPAQQRGRYLDTWKALVRLRGEGRIRSVGVSNFMEEQLTHIIDETGVVPALNQIELHPAFQQTALRAVHERLGIETQAWSPLGQGGLLKDPVLAEIGAKHGKTPAQVVLRWHVESGIIAIPKSATPERIESNFALFDFELDEDDIERIAALDDENGRVGPDPLSFPG